MQLFLLTLLFILIQNPTCSFVAIRILPKTLIVPSSQTVFYQSFQKINLKKQNTILKIKFVETNDFINGMDQRFYIKGITEPTVLHLHKLYETNELLNKLKQYNHSIIYLQPNIEFEKILEKKIIKTNWITKMNNDFFEL